MEADLFCAKGGVVIELDGRNIWLLPKHTGATGGRMRCCSRTDISSCASWRETRVNTSITCWTLFWQRWSTSRKRWQKNFIIAAKETLRQLSRQPFQRMANEEHIKLLEKGSAAWNEWRQRTKETHPDLSGANLREFDLRRAILDGADLSDAELSGTDLSGAKLVYANLCGAILAHETASRAGAVNLSGADLTRAGLGDANLTGANLSHATLTGADLTGAKLINVDLGRANLTEATVRCDLSYANLSYANLSGANLSGANLTNARFNGADLTGANLSHAKLGGADLAEAVFGVTILADIDLSEASGLETAEHKSFSSVGLDTLYKSQGRIPDQFLRAAGVPEDVIKHLLPLIRNQTRFSVES
jgi:uncharacterized protein YjbI with pentapeptide repeats